MMNKLIFILTLLLATWANAGRPMSLSGRVQDTSNVPIESSLVLFKVSISNSSDCIIFQEVHQIDMTGSNGYFKLTTFSGNASFNSNGTDLFLAKTYSCQNGSSWIAGQNDIRKVAVSVKVDSSPYVDFASDTINAAAYANEAEFLRGKTSSDFIQSSTISSQLKFDQLMLQQPAVLDLVNGTNTVYAKQNFVDAALNNKQNLLSYVPIDPASNLSELTNKAQARSNLGLGTLAIRSSITDADISAVAYSKITGLPSSFPPATHSHVMGDITGLATALSSKIDKSSFTCSSSQTINYNSITDSFSCVDISITGDVSGGLGATVVSKILGKTLFYSSIQDKDYLSYNGPSDRWENKSFGSISIDTIGDLSAGNLIARKQISGATIALANNTNTLDFLNGNIILTSNTCASNLDFANLKDGGTYTFINTNTGTAKCVFTASTIAGAIIKYAPANDLRTANVITVYAIMRAGNYILISWSSGGFE